MHVTYIILTNISWYIYHRHGLYVPFLRCLKKTARHNWGCCRSSLWPSTGPENPKNLHDPFRLTRTCDPGLTNLITDVWWLCAQQFACPSQLQRQTWFILSWNRGSRVFCVSLSPSSQIPTVTADGLPHNVWCWRFLAKSFLSVSVQDLIQKTPPYSVRRDELLDCLASLKVN